MESESARCDRSRMTHADLVENSTAYPAIRDKAAERLFGKFAFLKKQAGGWIWQAGFASEQGQGSRRHGTHLFTIAVPQCGHMGHLASSQMGLLPPRCFQTHAIMLKEGTGLSVQQIKDKCKIWEQNADTYCWLRYKTFNIALEQFDVNLRACLTCNSGIYPPEDGPRCPHCRHLQIVKARGCNIF